MTNEQAISVAAPAGARGACPRGRRGGFTLVEALSAGVILSLSAGALALAASRGMGAVNHARDLQRAAGLLDQTMTKLDLVGPARALDEGWTAGGFPAPDERFRWQAEIVPDPNSSLYDVTVTVLWPGPAGRARTVRARTLLNDPVGSHPETLLWDDL